MTGLRKLALSYYIARAIQIALNRPPRRYWYWQSKGRVWHTEDGRNLASSGVGAAIIELTEIEFARLKMQSGSLPVPAETKLEPGEVIVSDEEMALRLPGWNK